MTPDAHIAGKRNPVVMLTTDLSLREDPAYRKISEKFAKASEQYEGNPVALHLRAMNMVFEGLRQKGSMIIVPSTAVETMGLGALGGLTAFGQQAEVLAEGEAGDDDGVE